MWMAALVRAEWQLPPPPLPRPPPPPSSSSRLLALALLLAPALPLAQAADFTNPFCGYATARDAISLDLECAPSAGLITDVSFASYGTPDVSGGCGAFKANPACDLAGFLATVRAACLNTSACTVAVSHATPDPCVNTVKAIAVTASCAGAPGGRQVPAAPLVPSCATQNGAPPCPLPQPPWAPTWELSRSTICQPGNTAGFLNATEAARFGLVSLDWSIANTVWRPAGSPCNVSTGAAVLVEQCRQIKAVNPSTKCFVYRNTELALEWLEPQRAVMQDPIKAGWFLQYQPGNPSGTPPGTIYNEDAGGSAAGCKQFFWNYSVPEAAAYVLAESEQGALAIGSPYVDGTFLDDSQAIPQEHGSAPSNMGLRPSQLASLQNDTYALVQRVIDTLAARGRYVWQGFDGNRGGDPDEVAPAPTASNCLAFMSELCAPQWQAVPMTMQWNGRNETLAAFLIGRGPVAYLGWGWNGGPLPRWDAAFDMQVGTPLGLCSSTSAGVFTRAWSAGRATLDCNTFTATLDF